MSGWEGFLWGLIGSGLGELLIWFRRRQKRSMPAHFRSPMYWIVTSPMCVSGGLLVVAYIRSDIQVKPILASNIGASAPLLIQAFASKSPKVDPGRID